MSEGKGKGKGKGKGWKAGRARMGSGPGIKRVSILFSAVDLANIAALMTRWACRRPEAIRRALQLAVDAERAP